MEVSDERITGNRWSSRRRRGDSGAATTPLFDWRFYNRDSAHQRVSGGGPQLVSARKLAARWELAATTNCGGGVRWHNGLYDEIGFEFPSPSPLPKCAMGRATKWNSSFSKASAYVNHFYPQTNHLNDQEATTISITSSAESFKPQKCIREFKHFIHNEKETSSTMKTHHQLCTIIKNLKDDLRRERKTCKKMYIFNSKLQSDITEAESLATRIMHKYEKEKKARNLLVDICNKQAKVIETSKAKINELRDRCARIQEDVEEEREMLRITDSWREERARMKLDDAKFMLEDKYCEVNNLIEDVKTLLRSSSFVTNVNETSNIKSVEEVLNMFSKFDRVRNC